MTLATDLFDTFGLTAPITLDQLKSAYRVAARKLHPDLNPNDPYAEEKFKKMDQVYQRLQKDSAIFTVDAFKSIRLDKTVDGVPLVELGLGLGPLKNGKDCSVCQHRGYNTRPRTRTEFCSRCHGTGRIGFLQFCPSCIRGYVNVQLGHFYETCYKCFGTGEIEIHNPVIPKGWLSGPKTQRERKGL